MCVHDDKCVIHHSRFQFLNRTLKTRNDEVSDHGMRAVRFNQSETLPELNSINSTQFPAVSNL